MHKLRLSWPFILSKVVPGFRCSLRPKGMWLGLILSNYWFLPLLEAYCITVSVCWEEISPWGMLWSWYPRDAVILVLTGQPGRARLLTAAGRAERREHSRGRTDRWAKDTVAVPGSCSRAGNRESGNDWQRKGRDGHGALLANSPARARARQQGAAPPRCHLAPSTGDAPCPCPQGAI